MRRNDGEVRHHCGHSGEGRRYTHLSRHTGEGRPYTRCFPRHPGESRGPDSSHQRSTLDSGMRRNDGRSRHRPLQLSPEGAVLEGGEEGVQFGERGAMGGFQFFYGGGAAGEVALQVDGWERNDK